MGRISQSPRWTATAILTLALGPIANGCNESQPLDGGVPEPSQELPVAPAETSTPSQPPAEEAAKSAISTTKVPEPGSAGWDRLEGTIGSDSQWGSGWLNLSTPTDFAEGTRLRVRVGGTAKKIFVRLLARGVSPSSSQGIVGGAFTVPENRVVEVRLDTDRKRIIQISVHGGPNPWNKSLGANNGSATLEDV